MNAPNNRASKYMKTKPSRTKRRNRPITVIVWGIHTLISVIARTGSQQITKDILETWTTLTIKQA